jgi:membrane protein DedA with SNARE-associated domain
MQKMDLTGILLGAIQDPVAYSILFFIYVILAVIILPIPVEIGLFNPFIHPALLIFILAVGKGVGSFIAFEIGTRIRGALKKRLIGTTSTKKIVAWCERFIRKYGYYGLFIILSAPLMVDSVTVYLFSLLNPKDDGKTALTRRWFVLLNIAAGAVRGTIILLVAYFFSVRLV